MTTTTTTTTTTKKNCKDTILEWANEVKRIKWGSMYLCRCIRSVNACLRTRTLEEKNIVGFDITMDDV
jgi:hypothetical protein